MKKSVYSILVAAAVLISACRSETKKVRQHDPRPKDELVLLDELDKTYNNIDDNADQSKIDESTKSFNTYLVNHKPFKNWEAQLLRVTDKPLGMEAVEIQMMVRKEYSNTNVEDQEMDAVILTCLASPADTALINKIRHIARDEKILIDGNFTVEGKAPIVNSFAPGKTGKYVFNNPEIYVNLTDIRKIEVKSNATVKTQ